MAERPFTLLFANSRYLNIAAGRPQVKFLFNSEIRLSGGAG